MTKEIKVPDLGGATDVDVIEVHVKPGDHIKLDATLITLEGDKATMDIPAPEAGVVKTLKVKVGDKVSQGSVILTLEGEAKAAQTQKTHLSPGGRGRHEVAGEGETAPSTPTPHPSPLPLREREQPVAARPAKQEITTPPKTFGVHAGPAVRRYARTLGADLTQIKDSGPKGRILKEDVETYVKNALTQKQSAQTYSAGPKIPAVDFSKFGPVVSKPLSRIKKLTGVTMQRNWQVVPHVTQFDEADITELEAFRKEQQKAAQAKGVKLTLMAFLMKAAVNALKTHPDFNSSLDETGENLVFKHYFHLGIAIDTAEGLMVPVIRNVDKLGLFDCAEALQVVTNKARQQKITPGDLQGSCFTISSLGSVAGTAFTPIVNAPDVAILGVSRAAIKPVYIDGEFKPRLMLPLSLSYDHRVIDGVAAAMFTNTLCHLLSDIRTLLL